MHNYVGNLSGEQGYNLYHNFVPFSLMILAVALLGSRRTLGGVTAMPTGLFNIPKNVSGGSEMPSSMISMETDCTESPVKLRVSEASVKSKPAESGHKIYAQHVCMYHTLSQ